MVQCVSQSEKYSMQLTFISIAILEMYGIVVWEDLVEQTITT